jgi:CCR4-NOT transcription complex subunit 6
LVEFNQLAIEAADGSHDMINRVMTKDNIGLAALLETTEAIWQNGLPPEGRVNRPLLVATCHVHWDPEFCDVKLIQTMMLMHRLQTIIKEAQMSLRTENTEGSVDCNSIPLILCGDLNSLPDSGVVEYLRSGHVPTNHKDFKEIVYDDCLTKLSQTDSKEIYSHGFRLSQAYSKDIMPYTNYTYEFKGIIDYVFYSRDTMNCLGVLGSLDSNWFADNRVIGCPHPQIPSDHLPLLAQFEMNASPSNRHVNNYIGSTRR